MIPSRDYNFGPLRIAAERASLPVTVPQIKVPYHGGYVQGDAIWRRQVGPLLVDDHPKNHDLYRTKIKGKQCTIAKTVPIEAIQKWLKKLIAI